MYEFKKTKADNARLIAEQLSLKTQFKEKSRGESDDIILLRTHLESTQRREFEAKLELKALQTELNNIKHQASVAERLKAQSDNEKAGALDQLQLTTTQIEQTLQQLNQSQHELVLSQQANLHLEKRDKELRHAISRVRQLVDELASENADLKKNNEGHVNKLTERERKINELENLFTSTLAERDTAIKEARQLKLSEEQWRDSEDKMMFQMDTLGKSRDCARLEKEKLRLKLDKMAGTSFQCFSVKHYFSRH